MNSLMFTFKRERSFRVITNFKTVPGKFQKSNSVGDFALGGESLDDRPVRWHINSKKFFKTSAHTKLESSKNGLNVISQARRFRQVRCSRFLNVDYLALAFCVQKNFRKFAVARFVQPTAASSPKEKRRKPRTLKRLSQHILAVQTACNSTGIRFHCIHSIRYVH